VAGVPVLGDEPEPSDEREWLKQIEREYKLERAREESELMKQTDEEILSVISHYQDGAGAALIEKLRNLRHRYLSR
jgi:hypothetical protein